MNQKQLGLSSNLFSISSKNNKFKDKFLFQRENPSSKTILPFHMSSKQIRRGHRKKITERDLRKMTNRILRLHKKNPNLKPLKKIREELNTKIFAKYGNPYMKSNTHFITSFTKEKKILYYDYYQIGYILEKKKCTIYSRYKDFKLLYDNQDYFLKYFKQGESKIYLSYLLYITYAKDPLVKSNRIICLNKDIKKLRRDFNEIIVKNVFEAKRLIFSKNLNKYLPNISPKIYEATQKKISRIAIPKYTLIIKPIIAKRINYIYIKDVPNNKIPKIIPNYSNYDKKLFLIIKSFIIKKKFSILLINGKKVPNERNSKKNISREISRDNNILNSLRSSKTENDNNSNNSNLLYISKFFKNDKIFKINSDKRNFNIYDIEKLIHELNKNREEEEEQKDSSQNLEEILNNNNSESLNTIYENDKDVFLSSLKKPFIGKRENTEIKKDTHKIKEKDIKNKKFKSDSDKLVLYTVNYFNKNKKRNNNNKNKKFKLYLDLNQDEYRLNKGKNNYVINNEKNNIFKNYFNNRFIEPKKYREYLITSPFIKKLINLHYSYNMEKNINIKLEEKDGEREKNISSFSSDKSNTSLFKDTYKFLIGFNKKEKREALVNNLVNKSNKIFHQIKTLSEAEKWRSNFKKSGAFAFTSFKGINFDKKENEWDVTENYFKKYYSNSLEKSIMKKINQENNKQKENVKHCTTFKEIIKSSNIYL